MLGCCTNRLYIYHKLNIHLKTVLLSLQIQTNMQHKCISPFPGCFGSSTLSCMQFCPCIMFLIKTRHLFVGDGCPKIRFCFKTIFMYKKVIIIMWWTNNSALNLETGVFLMFQNLCTWFMMKKYNTLYRSVLDKDAIYYDRQYTL